MSKKNDKLIFILIIIGVVVLMMQGKKESVYVKTGLSDCLDRRNEIISGYSPSDPYWVSPCYQINSQMDSCSSWIEPGDVGDYIFGAERFGRANLDSDDEEAISCAEDYGDPNPSEGDCGGGLIWSNGWCVAACVDTTWTPATSTVCSGTAFTQTSNCGNTRSATGTKVCLDCNQLKSTSLSSISLWASNPTSINKNLALNAITSWALQC